ncbi:restriction endonuclease subunit S [Stenotrophomonas rhizophila]|uniref:restriction endonuclease subunit S n=1 Tax=Stenotrophomonas rhizophila TaxID=216778 RepID=UPI001E2B71B3|nr:restriction endonuclease subunit S [Stenotrophomonas rhizophila]MCC7634400.1 restriction endonuclease subunit S [Stenotrophomonas rhizophila]MCC7663798.1 restriction endonuclease subunit S [Stenotrophomonas rhizophila]
MNALTRIIALGDLASIRQGHPFRGAIAAVADGPVQVIQLKNLAVAGLQEREALLRTALRPRKAPHWVQDQDVLMAARGNHPMAMLLRDPPQFTVCSPHLYVLRVGNPELLLPAFLAWQLNQRPAQAYLRQQAAGSRQQSLRKVVVAQLPLQVPPLAQQQRVIAIARAAQAERQCLEALIHNRQQEIAAVAERVLEGCGA